MDATYTIAAIPGWNEELLHQLEALHARFLVRSNEWLDYAASVDLTTGSNTVGASWKDEWTQFTAFGSWPELTFYQQAMMGAFHDGAKGVQSVGYWIWLTMRPILYSMSYIFWRVAQVFLGTFLPTIQYCFIEILRFHLHLTWRHALGELFIILLIYAIFKLVLYLRRQRYLQRTLRFIRDTGQRITKSIQGVYREIAQVSLLLAMALPHAAYLGIAVAIRVAFPAWVTQICRDRMAPNLLKFYYPIVATIAVLHHTRSVKHVDSLDADHDISGRDAKSKSKIKDRKSLSNGDEKPSKTKRRRRSSLGNLLQRKKPSQQKADGTEYTEEQIREDVNYWLNFWILYSTFQAAYALASRIVFVGSLVQSDTFFTISCQLEFLFYIWIFVMPEMLLILFPSAGDEACRDWSPTKQWCYECALNPVLALPSLFNPVVIPFFEAVSQAVPAAKWQRYMVDKIRYFLQAAVMLRIISEQRSDTLLVCFQDFRALVVPAVTLVTPGFITRYGVWYVQYIVPQAHSLRGLHRQHRHEQRVLYLKFWILHGVVTGLFARLNSFFWWLPLFNHFTFVVWCVLVLPRVINAMYNEFDRELQAFGLLPPVEEGLAVEKTHTHRALSLILSSLPSADDGELKKLEVDADVVSASVDVGALKRNSNSDLIVKNDSDKSDETDVAKMADTGDSSNPPASETVENDKMADATESKTATSTETKEEKETESDVSTDKESQVKSSQSCSQKVVVGGETAEKTAQGKTDTTVRRSSRVRRRSP